MHNGKLVKCVSTPRFFLDLFETDDGNYYIRYKPKTGEVEYSENISDLSLALYLFEKKLSFVEGH